MVVIKWGFFSIQVVQEYERAVIFRLGRLLHGGSKGPGIVIKIYNLSNAHTYSSEILFSGGR